METLTLGELYHIMMMLTGVWVMIFSVIYLKAFLKKENRKQNYYKRKH